MFDGVLRHLTASSDRLKQDMERTDAALVIRNPEPLRAGITHLLTTMHDIVSDQSTLFELSGGESDDGNPATNPYEDALTYLTLAQSVVPASMLRPAAVVLFLLYQSLQFSESEGLEETALLARMDETLGSFGFGGLVSLVDLWAQTEEYVEQRRLLWKAVMGLLVTVGEECHVPPPAV